MAIVESVGVASLSRSGNVNLSRRVTAAMTKAVQDAYRDGVTDPAQQRVRILQARAAARGEVSPDPTRVMTLVDRLSSDRENAALQQSVAMEDTLHVLLAADRSVALGAALALLLQSAETHPVMLARVLRGTPVCHGTATISALEALAISTRNI